MNGFDNISLQTQAKMQRFTFMSDLLFAMNEITAFERGQDRLRWPYMQTDPLRAATSQTTSRDNKKNKHRCFNCNGSGHYVSVCTRPRREWGTCLICGFMEHRDNSCPTRRATTRGADITTHVVQVKKHYLIPTYIVSLCLDLGNKLSYISAVGNTGSPISLIFNQLVQNEIWFTHDPAVIFWRN